MIFLFLLINYLLFLFFITREIIKPQEQVKLQLQLQIIMQRFKIKDLESKI